MESSQASRQNSTRRIRLFLLYQRHTPIITLQNGHVQGPGGLAVPNGSISLVLNTDATIIASPNGIVQSSIPIVFQFDANGNLIQPAQIWSNLELSPQNSLGLGTWYYVTFYDANGARLNTPMSWQFQNVSGSTVDISGMTAYLATGE